MTKEAQVLRRSFNTVEPKDHVHHYDEIASLQKFLGSWRYGQERKRAS